MGVFIQHRVDVEADQHEFFFQLGRVDQIEMW